MRFRLITAALLGTVEDVRVREDHFDPCQQLSWLVIHGITGGAPTLGVVFSHQGELVRDASVLHSEIGEQTHLSESTVSIEYPAPENVYTVEHSWEPGGVALTGGDVEEFTSEILVGSNLDLTTPPTE